jgi:transmembrane sensor
MEPSDFDKLLNRYLQGKLSGPEKTKLEAWLDSMKSENTTHLDLTKEEEDLLFQKITSNINTIEEVARFVPKQTRHQKIRSWSLRIAASVVILLAAVWFFREYTSTNNTANYTPANGLEKVILNDGTLVWFRPGTQLAYHENPGQHQRITRFEGDALFEVAKDPRNPFIIHAGEVTMTVLGTSFALTSGNQNLELTVLTGQVNVSVPHTNVNIDVNPGEKLRYADGHVEKNSLEPNTKPPIIDRTEYNMEFTNTSLHTILEKVESKFNVTIKLSDPKAGACRITANFTDHNLETTLRMITEVLEVEYTRKGNTITITGPGCPGISNIHKQTPQIMKSKTSASDSS